MKQIRVLLAAFVAAFGLLAGATASADQFIGFNPTTGLLALPGTPIAAGVLPVLDATTSCGTLATVKASQVGGSGVFQITANATTCTLVIDFPSAAPNGYFCVAIDETTPADTVKQSVHTTTSCTVTGTVVSADKVLVEVNGF